MKSILIATSAALALAACGGAGSNEVPKGEPIAKVRPPANESTEELKKLVDTGVVAMEFRPFLVHGVQDIPGFLLSQCSGPEAFYPLSEALFADQPNWLGKMSGITEAEQQAAAKMTPAEVATFLGTRMGLIEFVQQRGISADQAKACLADTKAIDGLIKLTEQGGKDGVTGTPYFTLNGAPMSGLAIAADALSVPSAPSGRFTAAVRASPIARRGPVRPSRRARRNFNVNAHADRCAPPGGNPGRRRQAH